MLVVPFCIVSSCAALQGLMDKSLEDIDDADNYLNEILIFFIGRTTETPSGIIQTSPMN